LSWDFKKLKPEDVEVGDIYLIGAERGDVIPAMVTKVNREMGMFSYGTLNGGGNQRFDYTIRGVLVKVREGKVELFSDEDNKEILAQLREGGPDQFL